MKTSQHLIVNSEKFPKSERLRKQKEILEVLKNGLTIDSPYFTLKYLQGPKLLFGVLVPHNVDRRAVVRNRLKRYLKEIYRTNKSLFSPIGLYLFIVRAKAKELDFHHTKDQVFLLLQKFHVTIKNEALLN
jgi:ribonuclease P protein component